MALAAKKSVETVLPQPRWDGSDLQGKTILLRAEQGLGDTLHFIRYAALVKQRGGTVVVACQKPLLRLLQTCPGIDRLVVRGTELPPFDVQAPLLSLPGIFQTALTSIPARVPYVFADAGLVEHWRQRLATLPGFKVGIAWQGNPQVSKVQPHFIPLGAFEPLARLPEVQLISLQKGPGAEQLTTLNPAFPVTDLGTLDEAAGPFMDTAAIVKNLDLVISADTVTAHLAGALGVPTWVALPFFPDWRWLLDREDSPWYPTLRLFRQAETGGWPSVFARMTAALAHRAGN